MVAARTSLLARSVLPAWRALGRTLQPHGPLQRICGGAFGRHAIEIVLSRIRSPRSIAPGLCCCLLKTTRELRQEKE